MIYKFIKENVLQKLPFIISGHLKLCCLFFLTLVSTVTFIYEKLLHLPQKQELYANLRLGMTMAEVQYIKGYPDLVSQNIEKENDQWRLFPDFGTSIKELKQGEHLENYTEWFYNLEKSWGEITASFDPATKKLIKIKCYSNGFECPALLGITDGADEQVILKEFGKPSHEEIFAGMKEMTYDKLGVLFYLSKMKVYMMEIKTVDR